MPVRKTLLVSLILLPATFLACQTGAFQGPEAAAHNPPSEVLGPKSGSLALELDRAILILRQGQREHWGVRKQYLSAFEKTPSTDLAGRNVTEAKGYVKCVLGAHLRTHEVWDEGPPIEVEVQRAIVDLTKRRSAEASELQPEPCRSEALRKVTLSAGVAMSLLKTRVEPVYPTGVLRSNVSGTVVLHATISNKGFVESLQVISGHALLQQSALDAVRQWTYRPYLLNNEPVEVETTINVVVAPAGKP